MAGCVKLVTLDGARTIAGQLDARLRLTHRDPLPACSQARLCCRASCQRAADGATDR